MIYQENLTGDFWADLRGNHKRYSIGNHRGFPRGYSTGNLIGNLEQGCKQYFSFCELHYETENFLWKSVTFGTENLVSCRNIWLFLQQMNKLRKFCPKMSSGIEFQNSHVKTFGNWWYSVNIFCETSWFQIFSANLVRRFRWFLNLCAKPARESKWGQASSWGYLDRNVESTGRHFNLRGH